MPSKLRICMRAGKHHAGRGCGVEILWEEKISASNAVWCVVAVGQVLFLRLNIRVQFCNHSLPPSKQFLQLRESLHLAHETNMDKNPLVARATKKINELAPQVRMRMKIGIKRMGKEQKICSFSKVRGLTAAVRGLFTLRSDYFAPLHRSLPLPTFQLPESHALPNNAFCEFLPDFLLPPFVPPVPTPAKIVDPGQGRGHSRR